MTPEMEHFIKGAQFLFDDFSKVTPYTYSDRYTLIVLNRPQDNAMAKRVDGRCLRESFNIAKKKLNLE